MILTGNLLELAYDELCHKLNHDFNTRKEQFLIARIFSLARRNAFKKRWFREDKRITTIEGDYPFSITQYEPRLDSKQLAVAFFEHYRDEDPVTVFKHLCLQAFMKIEIGESGDDIFYGSNFLVLSKTTIKVGDRTAYEFKGLTAAGTSYVTRVFDPVPIETELKRNHQTRPYIEVKG